MEDCGMPRKRYKAEEIVTKLRQMDVLTAQGRLVAEVIRSARPYAVIQFGC
jgi:hypothetical protein